MKNKIKKFIKKFIIVIVLIVVLITLYEYIRPTVVSKLPDNSFTVEAVEAEEVELTGMDLLMASQRAIEAGRIAQENEAKQMRLEEIAEEAKELQESLK